MSTSSLPPPDAVLSVEAICEERLGRRAGAFERIGGGRNSRVFRVPLVDGDTVVVKFYRRDAGDTRDRLATEFGALRFMWDNGVRVVPRPIADDRGRYCAIYEYLDGDPPATVGEADVDALVDFLAAIQPLRPKAGEAHIGVASEASFSLGAVEAHVKARADRLRGSAGEIEALQRWFDRDFDPLFAKVAAWYRTAAGQAGQAADVEIESARRTLSPSDFGFHNAIRRPDGSLAFVDFEYFGWDDPAKTIVDFLLHPGMTLPEPLKTRFADRLLRAFGLRERARIVYPLFGLKWCLILLNDFLPGRATTATREVRELQLAKARALTGRIRREYCENPFV
jgi:hypothetical protein